MKHEHALRCATAVSFALALSTAYAADDPNATTNQATNPPQPAMTGKQKATAIGAGTGAVAGAVVGGPVGAVVGAGIGGYVGHEGTDANGKVNSTDSKASNSSAHPSDNTVRSAQMALNGQGYDAGQVDGQFGPTTQSAVRRFQAERGLNQSGVLDNATLTALGVRS